MSALPIKESILLAVGVHLRQNIMVLHLGTSLKEKTETTWMLYVQKMTTYSWKLIASMQRIKKSVNPEPAVVLTPGPPGANEEWL